MTNDLVKRLRMWVYECEEQNAPGMWAQDMSFAADRIEELEAIINKYRYTVAQIKHWIATGEIPK